MAGTRRSKMESRTVTRVLRTVATLGRSPPFVLAALIISAAAVGLRPAFSAVARRYSKESIGLRKPLAGLDLAALPSFGPASRPPTAHPSIRDVGTSDFVFTEIEPQRLGSARMQPALFVTYYSNPRDKVPHTPDVCYRQAGCTVVGLETAWIELDCPGMASERIEVRVVELARAGQRRLVVYVFCACGEFCCDRERVRWIIGRPGERYVYFSKIETTTPYMLPDEKPAALRVCCDLLREALPVLLRDHFPSQADLRAR